MATPPSAPSALRSAPSSLAGPAEIDAFAGRRTRGAWWVFLVVAVIAGVVAAVAAPREPMAFAAAGAFLVVCALFTAVGNRRLNATWKGVVAGKRVREVNRQRKSGHRAVRLKEIHHLIDVRLDGGGTRTVRVGAEAFERYFNEGDRVVKIRGLGIPVKAVCADGALRLCGHCGVLLEPVATVCPRCRCPVPDPARF
jgi:hypothetical protein